MARSIAITILSVSFLSSLSVAQTKAGSPTLIPVPAAIPIVSPLASSLDDTSVHAGKVEVKTSHDTRPFREVENEVEELMTSEERVEALSIISSRLKDEKRESVRADFRKLQDQIGDTFLTEKGLQFYELGRSLVFSDMPLALSRFNEALVLDPGNVAVLTALARAHLHMGDCASSLGDTRRALELNENYKAAQFVKLQALVCLQKKKDAQDLLTLKQGDQTFLSSLPALLARGQLALLEGSFVEASASFEKAKLADSKMPEVYYWLGQTADQEKKESTIYYRQYIEFCQEPNRDKRRQYDQEPRTCLEAKTVEHLLETRVGKLKG